MNRMTDMTAGLVVLCLLAAPRARADATTNSPPPRAARASPVRAGARSMAPHAGGPVAASARVRAREVRCLNKDGHCERVCEWTDGYSWDCPAEAGRFRTIEADGNRKRRRGSKFSAAP